jgi:hypothetical protein
MKIRATALCVLATLFLCPASVQARPEAFEIGPDNTDQLPQGKEADGIIGDFVLRNDVVEAVISHNALLRRANMSTFYGDNGVTPGCLYDLTLRGSNNDQITVFTPSGQQGLVSYVRVAKDGSDGEAVVETVITAASNNGLYKRHEYRLRDGWQGVLIVTTYRNESKKTAKGTVNDRWTNFSRQGKAGDITWADAVDPADKAGYAYAWVERDGMKNPGGEVTLEPGQEISFARFLAVGRSPAEAAGVVAAQLGETGLVEGVLKQAGGQPVTTAEVEFQVNKAALSAYPDDKGMFSLRLPVGEHPYKVRDHGRADVTGTIKIAGSGTAKLQHADLPVAAAVAFDIRDAGGKSIPCKAQFHGINGTKNPNFGPANRAHGCVDQYFSARGQFRVPLDPGNYRIIVTRGIEFSHLAQEIKLEPGKTVTVKGTLQRLVDTTGWVSADYHNHSTPSGDNTCGTDDRIISLAAEQVEFAPTTEHNRLYDWRPHIYKLGLQDELQTVPGMELTGSGSHFNSFPFKPEPFQQDNGAPVWNKDPRITAITLRDWQGAEPDRWIQINHPDMVFNFTDRDGDGNADGGFLGLAQLIDGIETDNFSASEILSKVPFRIGKGRSGREEVYILRQFVWLQLLNRGHRYAAVGVCDAHSVYGNGVGGWRMYMPSKSDKPAEIDWRENSRHAKAGRSILTTGPFLQVETEDGTLPGGTTRAPGGTRLKVRVQCTDWIDIDRVQVLVNGRQEPSLNFTRQSHAKMFQDGVVKFEATLNVPLSEDAHLIVVAVGENHDLSTGYGTSSQARIKPIAYHNPIFVDVDGHGFTPNGDLLDWPLPTKKLSVEDAKAMLEARK